MTAFRSCVRELTEKKRIISARMTKPMTDFIMLINGRNAFSSSHPFLVLSGIISCPRSPVNRIAEKSIDHMVEKAYNNSRVQEVHEMKREEKNQQTRSKIVNGAIREFSEHGFEAGSLNVICEEQGISKGIIYHYFPSKEMLYLECIRTCQQEMIRYLNEHLQNQEGNLLKEYFECRNEYYKLHPDDARLFESAVLFPPEEVKTEIRETWNAFDERRKQLIRNAVRQIPLREELSEEEVVNLILKFLDDRNARHLSEKETSSEKEEDLALDIFLNGIRKR